MWKARRSDLALCVLFALMSGAALAQPQLHCHIELAGESRELEVGPVSDPYGVKAIDLGSGFRFKAVMLGDPSRIDYVKTYVYFQTSRRVILLHSARFLSPHSDANTSLTGLNRVYAPSLERELKYECRLSEAQP